MKNPLSGNHGQMDLFIESDFPDSSRCHASARGAGRVRRASPVLRGTGALGSGARGHWQVIGTPSQIADQMEAWFNEEAADGFNVMPAHLPLGLTDFIDQVLPELRRRGLFRHEYEGHSLRDNLGLKQPRHPHGVQVAAE